MHNEPFFSVVIVNYNGGVFLEDAIKSVLSQEISLYELIVIDGKSTDNSLKIINKYIQHMYYFVSESDNGQSDAFNKGFAQARGDYYLWLNADDLLLPNCLRDAHFFIQKFPNQKWFAANTIFTDINGVILKCSRAPNWLDCAIERGVIYVNGPTSIFHKDLYTMAGGFDVNCHYSMDTDLWIRFKILGYKFRRINKYFWSFRIHENSKTSDTLMGYTNPALNTESDYISEKNNYYYTRKSQLKQIILKLISGSFIRSRIDTWRFKGNNISEGIKFFK
jgi:glycosyltransferase involved in cell wall biosynthesis